MSNKFIMPFGIYAGLVVDYHPDFDYGYDVSHIETDRLNVTHTKKIIPMQYEKHIMFIEKEVSLKQVDLTAPGLEIYRVLDYKDEHAMYEITDDPISYYLRINELEWHRVQKFLVLMSDVFKERRRTCILHFTNRFRIDTLMPTFKHMPHYRIFHSNPDYKVLEGIFSAKCT